MDLCWNLLFYIQCQSESIQLSGTFCLTPVYSMSKAKKFNHPSTLVLCTSIQSTKPFNHMSPLVLHPFIQYQSTKLFNHTSPLVLCLYIQCQSAKPFNHPSLLVLRPSIQCQSAKLYNHKSPLVLCPCIQCQSWCSTDIDGNNVICQLSVNLLSIYITSINISTTARLPVYKGKMSQVLGHLSLE